MLPGTGHHPRAGEHEGVRRLFLAQVRALVCCVHHGQELQGRAPVRPQGDLVRLLEGPQPLVACGILGDLQQMCVAVVLRFSSNPDQQMFGFAVAPGVHDS